MIYVVIVVVVALIVALAQIGDDDRTKDHTVAGFPADRRNRRWP